MSEWGGAVAVIGMSGRFPGAPAVEPFWRNLLAGTSSIRPVTEDELEAAGVDPGFAASGRYVAVAAPLDDIEQFDAGFFGLPDAQADITDPQHRLFLECCWEALESAGYDPLQAPSPAGVFASSGFPTYLFQIAAQPELLAEHSRTQLAIANDRDSFASTVSHKLDLRGPSVSVQSFSSSSLVAVHLACQSLLTFESELALAGAASIELPQPAGYVYEEGGLLSPDGACRPFDERAAGTVVGNAVAVVALRRMADAVADGDHIHAVIRGSAVNNAGAARAGYAVPGIDGQADVLSDALAVADLTPDGVDYVECHGSGTLLGDSAELAALERAFSGRATPCLIGSVKANVGHVEAASGVTGLIKAALSLERKVIPPTLAFERPNPALDLDRGAFRVVTEPLPWPERDRPRRAGVSSFGLGGTNAHVVLEAPPVAAALDPVPGPHLLVLSARTPGALVRHRWLLRDHLVAQRGIELADVAATLQHSRSGFNHRIAVVCDDTKDAIEALADDTRHLSGVQTRRAQPVTIWLPEPEAWLRTAVRPLAGVQPAYAAALDRCAEALGVTGLDELGDEALEAAALYALADLLHSLSPKSHVSGAGRGAAAAEVVLGRRPLDAILDRGGAEADAPLDGLVVSAGPTASAVAPSDGLVVSAGPTASAVARSDGLVVSAGPTASAVITFDRDADPVRSLHRVVAELWLGGASVDWAPLQQRDWRRQPLPTYPFERSRHWIDRDRPVGSRAGDIEEGSA